MCGLFGTVGLAPLNNWIIDRVHARQSHRGPDDRGSWSGRLGESWLTLAFQRLSIIDLSANAAQPFRSPFGSVLVYNGEIYNYVELRRDLERKGVAFNTSSDTEVLLAALDHYGIESALDRLNGMFAFAWLCGRTGRLWIARDRVGEKPLYYWQDGPNLAFASEIKTLLEVVPDHHLSPNMPVIHKFLVNGVVDDTAQTFFEGICSLQPAHYAEVVNRFGEWRVVTHAYWPRPGTIAQNHLSLEDNIAELRHLLSDAIRIRLRSDVPLGFLVSGGLDSSAIVALALRHGIDRDRVNVFSIVNPQVPTDESHWIDLAAEHLRIPVTKVLFDPNGEDLRRLIDEYVYIHDEPFGDLPDVAHTELMKAAYSQNVTVLLSGQGGDELFCGYKKYLYFAAHYLLRHRQPFQALKLLGAFTFNKTVLPQFSVSAAARYTSVPLPGFRSLPFGERLLGMFRTDIGLSKGTIRGRQLADLLHYSVPAIAHAEDRSSMALSREVRFPFLDRRIIEFALGLPTEHKIAKGWTKLLLRLMAEPLLPPEIVWRRDKTGHFTASKSWLIQRGDALRSCLQKSSPVFQSGILTASDMLLRWNAFWDGRHSSLSVRQVVSILTLDLWFRKFSRSLRH